MKFSRIAPCIALLVLAMALVPVALAGKGGTGKGGSGGGTTSGGTSSVTGPVMVVDLTGNSLPNWGDTVTFDISTTATAQPYVNLVCSGYNSWKGVFAGSLDTNWNFVLSSGGWTSGANDCTATLGYYTKQGFQKLASTSFHVDA
jgi:hypothetical protein